MQGAGGGESVLRCWWGGRYSEGGGSDIAERNIEKFLDLGASDGYMSEIGGVGSLLNMC